MQENCKVSAYCQVLVFILALVSDISGQPRYCDNVDLSAFCILDNHFKVLVQNATIVEYYPQFREILTDIFDAAPWKDDDTDPGFAEIPRTNMTPIPRATGKSVYSFQEMCDLKTVLFKTSANGPDQFANNPYHIEVTEITVEGRHLHNHLHFRIYSDRSELNAQNKATGMIRYAFIVVHDRNGWPVGDFETGVPCDDDCNCPRGPTSTCHQGEFKDAIPCMFVYKDAVTHPGQMMIYGGATGLSEIHATWRFAQSTSPTSFTDQIHIKTLLIEDAREITKERDCRINFRFTNMFAQDPTRLCSMTNPISCVRTYVPRTGKFGWTAQYDILWPSLETLGAWDHFPRGFIRRKSVQCHNPLSQTRYFREPYPSYTVDRVTLDALDQNCPWNGRYEIARAGPSLITAGLANLYSKFTWVIDIKLYHGSPPQSFLPLPHLHQENQRPRPPGTPRYEFNRFPTLKEIAFDERCRCPRKGTPPPPPDEKAPPVGQLEGRKDHAIQMTIAWIVLVPFAIFVSRYYKETYSKVFFLQEFWWYTIHVLSLILAAMFMIGGTYAIEIKRDEAFNYEDNNQLLHVILGGVALFMFSAQILLGHQRAKKPQHRRIQIFFHWFFGLLEYFLALFSMINAAWIRAGCMSCPNIAFVVAWLFVQIAFYIVMEIHMRKVDKELHLVPKRSYLPPPVMRVFHVSAPGCKFRIAMLVAYLICCVSAYGIMHYYIEYTRAYRSCFNFDLSFEAIIVQFQPN